MIFILIQIKFDININNDELLETIWEQYKKKKREKKLFIIDSAKYRGAQVSIKDTESSPLVGTDNLKLNKFIFRKNYLS
jgi:hypothetical protein